MEQEVRFCTSADGTRIAYAIYRGGSGTPLVAVASWPTAMEQAWKEPESRSGTEARAKGRLFVEFDRRGTGASQREVNDLSTVAHVHDLEAVVNHLGLDHFDLCGAYDGCAVAVQYAVERSERVSHLVLFNAYVRGDQAAASKRREQLIELIRSDWSFARRVLATSDTSYTTADKQKQYSRMIRESITGEMAIRYLEYMAELDIHDILPRLQTPTLVTHRLGDENVTLEAGREVAALIPNARFVVLEDQSAATITRILSTFLEYGAEVSVPQPPTGTAIILFADIVDSTALTERMGDAAFRAKARELDSALRSIIGAHSGTAIEGKLLGDGVLAVFTAARDAITAAIACRDASATVGFELHLGLHAGDVIREANNVYGGAVNIAARISALSAPGEVLVSDTVRSLARTSAGVTFEDRGEHSLKGIAEAQRVFAVIVTPS